MPPDGGLLVNEQDAVVGAAIGPKGQFTVYLSRSRQRTSRSPSRRRWRTCRPRRGRRRSSCRCPARASGARRLRHLHQRELEERAGRAGAGAPGRLIRGHPHGGPADERDRHRRRLRERPGGQHPRQRRRPRPGRCRRRDARRWHQRGRAVRRGCDRHRHGLDGDVHGRPQPPAAHDDHGHDRSGPLPDRQRDHAHLHPAATGRRRAPSR